MVISLQNLVMKNTSWYLNLDRSEKISQPNLADLKSIPKNSFHYQIVVSLQNLPKIWQRKIPVGNPALPVQFYIVAIGHHDRGLGTGTSLVLDVQISPIFH